MITLIAACSKNRVIGKDNKLIWYISDDLKRFKALTTNKTVVMGRKTYESIGKPLPNRQNIILTRNKDFTAPGCLIYNHIDEIKSLFREYVVIGGSELYNQFIKIADVIELTLIEKEFYGDSYFPEIDNNLFEITNKEDKKSEEFDYSFITYKRI